MEGTRRAVVAAFCLNLGIAASKFVAAYYSASRTGGQVEVDIARRRHVRKIKGAGPGMVTYRNERTIAVRPADEQALSSRLSAG